MDNRHLRILWFTNNTVNLNTNTLTGGWMQSLARYFIADGNIQLFIATRANGKTLRKIESHKTTYYLVPDKRGLWQKRMDLMLNREPIQEYLQGNLQVINEVQPDVIQVCGSEMDYGLICGLTDIPVVIHIQGILQPYFYQLKKLPIPFWRQLSACSLSDYIKGNTLYNGLKIFQRRTGVEESIFKCCRYLMGRTAWDKRVSHILAPQAQ